MGQRQETAYNQGRMEHGQSDIVLELMKMADPFTSRWIMDRYRNRLDWDTGPGGPDQGLDLEIISGPGELQLQEFLDRIETETALGVGKVKPTFKPDPEI